MLTLPREATQSMKFTPPPRTRPRGRSLVEELAKEVSEPRQTQAHGEDIVDEQRTRRQDSWQENFKPRQRRYPLLQLTVDELLEDERRSTPFSPLRQEQRDANVPVTDDCPIQTSQLISSPVPFPGFQDSPLPRPRRTGSPRTTSYELERSGSMRRPSRRNTKGSTSSSWSPASAFLSQWNRNEDTATAQPDDEGQEIGLHTKYVLGRQIGYGGFSVIKEAITIEKGDRKVRAVKIVRKQIENKSEQENEAVQTSFEHETSIWRTLKHPYVLSLIDVYDDSFATFCITQLNIGGTLFDLVRSLRRANSASNATSVIASTTTVTTSTPTDSPTAIPKQSRKFLSLHLAKRYIYQVASALRYLHRDVHLVHRDIKLENCLVDISSTSSASSSSGLGGNILLCDFGMAAYISSRTRANLPSSSSTSSRPSSLPAIGPSHHSTNFNSQNNDAVIGGSLPYASPELISATSSIYDTSIDMWAFGVLCYALLTQDLPFEGGGLSARVPAMILKGQWDKAKLLRLMEVASCEPEDAGKRNAEEALDLVRGCLTKDLSHRWTVEQVLSCAFLRGCREMYEVDV